MRQAGRVRAPHQRLRLLTVTPTTTLRNPAVDGEKLMSALKSILEIMQNNTILTLGQNEVYPGALLCHGEVAANIMNDLPAACPRPVLT
jgi:hypothetical protein